VIIFGSVRFLYKKNNQTEFFKKKTETGSNRTVSVCFFWFGSVLAQFFSGFGSVRFFQFQAYKTKTEPVGFFKILIGLIGFYSRFDFFGYFFSSFLGLFGFLIFLLTPTIIGLPLSISFCFEYF
jgi:hypothetical protein